MTSGFLYCGTGKKYLAEAQAAASFHKQTDPSCQIAIATDDVDSVKETDCFDHVVPMADAAFGHEDKIIAMERSPFEKTVYLDTDTRVLLPINDLFEMLEQFPLLICHAPRHRRRYKKGGVDESLPDAFPQLNTGVIGFTKSTAVFDLLADWKSRNEVVMSEYGGDQGAFRHALWNSGIRLYILPSEYNFRPHQIACKSALSRVKVIHSRWLISQGDQTVRDFADVINQFEHHASWVPHNTQVSFLPLSWRKCIPKVIEKIKVIQPGK